MNHGLAFIVFIRRIQDLMEIAPASMPPAANTCLSQDRIPDSIVGPTSTFTQYPSGQQDD